MSKKEIIGQATPEQIQEWKKKSKDGVISQITVRDKEGAMHVCYLRTPERKDISAASVASRVDVLKYGETLLRQCWVGGDTEIRSDDDMFLAASGKAVELVEVGEAELEKL